MIIDEIKVILENNEYELDSDTISRIQIMLFVLITNQSMNLKFIEIIKK